MSEFEWTWETAHKSMGAGIVIVKKIQEEWRVLGLWCRGGYDITKGHIDEGEEPLETALRECAEEANITQVDMKWGRQHLIADNLVVYLGTTDQEPEIIPNPNSGIIEHEHLKWLDWAEMKEKTYPYLLPSIDWAQRIIEDET